MSDPKEAARERLRQYRAAVQAELFAAQTDSFVRKLLTQKRLPRGVLFGPILLPPSYRPTSAPATQVVQAVICCPGGIGVSDMGPRGVSCRLSIIEAGSVRGEKAVSSICRL